MIDFLNPAPLNKMIVIKNDINDLLGMLKEKKKYRTPGNLVFLNSGTPVSHFIN